MDWQPHKDGFVKGNIGVFPVIPDAWAVWDNFSGEWEESEPFTAAGRQVHTRTADGYHSYERTREETIAEAKRLAEAWLTEREASAKSIADALHPAPWSVVSTTFGESMGYDSVSRVLDANGRHVTTIGNGVADLIPLHERIAKAIVAAANR